MNLLVSPSELNSLLKKEYDLIFDGACVGRAVAEAFTNIKSPDTLAGGKVYCAVKDMLIKLLFASKFYLKCVVIWFYLKQKIVNFPMITKISFVRSSHEIC